ncbi:Fur family transcriptional regulator [Brevibacterium sp.]|uniref:Fur family transcriptional regulator n=1 Tax=Brevibacterium sp. TaxID=1701 RepID=UPI0028111052|nr:Fur family transcriptional regulator [Brevibacterium sp.]
MSEEEQKRAEDCSAALRNSSLRVTKQRVAVLQAVDTHPHADTETVIRAVREDLPEVSHQAVYDSLHALTEVGLVRCIQPSGSLARYERRVGDNHHHLVCRSCNLIVDVDCTIGRAPCLTPSHDHGFIVEQAEVTFWGLCSDCAVDTPEQERERSESSSAA